MEQKRSLFGPLALISAGVIWLLVQAEIIPSANLWALTHVWPFLLIAAGAGLILRSFWKYASILLDVVIIGGLILAIIFAPKFGWDNPLIFSFSNNGDMSFIGPGVPGSGNVITETREISGVESVSLEYPANIFIKQGKAESLKIEADDNLLPDIKTQVKNGTLEIFYKSTNNNHVNPTKPVIITITVKDLTKVDFSSAGELTIDGLNTDSLDVTFSGAGNLKLKDIDLKKLSVDLSGAGSFTASGTADDLDIEMSGFGDFKAPDLHGKSAQVDISGAGSATLWVDSKLDVSISGAGSVNYYGAAKVTKDVNGLGGVTHLGNK